MRARGRWSCCLALLVLTGCSPSSDPPADSIAIPATGPLTVYVVNYPLQYFAQRIGGEHVNVVFATPAGEDPAFWKPDTETIAAFQQAHLILLNGASYAKWIRTVSLPETRLVDTTADVVDQYITVEDAVTHSHGPGGEHAHTGTASTTWLDPQIAVAQAKAVQQALVRLRPELEGEFQENLDALSADLGALDQELGELVDGKSDRPVIFSHPVYQYLQRRYKLNAQSLDWRPEEVPPQEMWDGLAGMLEQHPAKWMVWESTPIDEIVNRLASLGIQNVVFDPCGNIPDDGDYMEVMRRNAENLRRAMAE